MSGLGYPEHSSSPGPGKFNPMDKFIVPYVKEFTLIHDGYLCEYHDYMACEDEYGAITYVAKPKLLRSDERDGARYVLGSINVTLAKSSENSMAATDDTGTEDAEVWYITPDYQKPRTVDGVVYPGETITAVYRNTGLATLDTGTTSLAHGSEPIVWEDRNEAGRCWAAE